MKNIVLDIERSVSNLVIPDQLEDLAARDMADVHAIEKIFKIEFPAIQDTLHA